MRILLAMVVAVAGCAGRTRGLDYSALAASTAALACDWRQTRSMATEGWTYRDETNPIMGPAPSTERVDVYFLGTAALNAAVWLALPPTWRSVYGFGVTGLETKSVTVNAVRGVPVCDL